MPRLSRLLVAVTLSAAVLAAPALASATTDTYVVRSGDTLITIASREGVRLSELMRANGLTLTSVIFPGQRLTIPGSTAPAPTAASASRAYTVRAGDTLSGIAARHGVRLAELLSANRLSITSLIVPGQRLTIPGAGAAGAPAAPAGVTYTVRSGDALSTIAARHGVRLADLLRANRLTITSMIHPGQRLTIPGATAGNAAPAAPAAGATYTVRSGDALSTIAARHNVSLQALLSLNGLSMTSLITPGQRLRLPAGATTTRVGRVVDFALGQVGKRYVFFTRGPATFDCSGLTLAAYAQVGIPLIHHSATQSRQGTAVDFRNQPIRAGDLVFLATNGSPRINHVGIAVSSTTWVQARSERLGVQHGPLPPDRLILAVRRFLPAG